MFEYSPDYDDYLEWCYLEADLEETLRKMEKEDLGDEMSEWPKCYLFDIPEQETNKKTQGKKDQKEEDMDKNGNQLVEQELKGEKYDQRQQLFDFAILAETYFGIRKGKRKSCKKKPRKRNMDKKTEMLLAGS